jgi:hypothetical protein
MLHRETNGQNAGLFKAKPEDTTHWALKGFEEPTDK